MEKTKKKNCEFPRSKDLRKNRCGAKGVKDIVFQGRVLWVCRAHQQMNGQW